MRQVARAAALLVLIGGAQGLAGDYVGVWHRSSKLATMRGGALRLDALLAKQRVAVFRRDRAFADASIRVEFQLENTSPGEAAVGIIFGSTDSKTYYHLHLTRTLAVLYRSTPQKPQVELARRAGFRLHERQLYGVRVDVAGSRAQVYLAGRLFFQANAPGYRGGTFGVYAENAVAQFAVISATGKAARAAWRWHADPKKPKPTTAEPADPKPATTKPADPKPATAGDAKAEPEK